ncbi:MAG: YtxH domain-containing protein [Patescibacteria group bacterium]
MFRSLKGLLAGLIAGTALGVLFSPKKGSEIRKNIKKEVKGGGTGLHTVKDTLVEMSKDIGGTSKDIYENIPEERKEQALSTLKKAKQKAKKLFNHVKGRIGS